MQIAYTVSFPGGTGGILTDYWRDAATGSYYSDASPAEYEWYGPPPDGMTDIYEIDQYVWNLVPEPATVLLLDLGGLLLRKRRA